MRATLVVTLSLSLAAAGIVTPARAHDPLDPAARMGRLRHQVHSHNGSRVYRANGGTRGISVLEPARLRVLHEIVTDEPVDLVALSQDGRWLYGISPRADSARSSSGRRSRRSSWRRC